MPNLKGKKNTKQIILGVLAALLLFGGIVFFLEKTNRINILSPITKDSNSLIGDSGKVENPLTGELLNPKDALWVDNRPLAVMINNHTDARPQSGLIYADLTYEIVAEGGITRILPFFLSTDPEKVGPVRSTRDYYLVLVKELGDAMLMHIGWSPQALLAIESWPVRSLGRGGGNFYRDTSRNVPVEHTAYTNAVELRDTAVSLGWEGTRPFQVWEFKNDFEGYEDAALSAQVAVDFWLRGDYSAIFTYDPTNNTYLRSMGYDAEGNPIPHRDNETQEQVTLKNVIVQFAEENSVVGDDKGRLSYELIGSGNALIFLDGKVINSTWSKAGRDDRTMFYDLNGNEIAFNRGKIWISIVPDRNVDQVVY